MNYKMNGQQTKADLPMMLQDSMKVLNIGVIKKK
jgi:hypothetical protein